MRRASSTAVGDPSSRGSRIGHERCMPWTYILECADNSLYVGSTYDLERRVSEHNLGLGAT